MTKILEISQKKNIQEMVRKEVIDVVREVLSDSDAGLKLSQAFMGKLKKSIKDKERGEIIPLSKLLKQYNI